MKFTYPDSDDEASIVIPDIEKQVMLGGEDFYKKMPDFLFWVNYDVYVFRSIAKLIFLSRGTVIFIWLLTSPIFRKVLKDRFFDLFNYILCMKRKKNDPRQTDIEFEDLLDTYNNTNSFLYSSLNMEIVCSILKGINVVVRELNIDNKV